MSRQGTPGPVTVTNQPPDCHKIRGLPNLQKRSRSKVSQGVTHTRAAIAINPTIDPTSTSRVIRVRLDIALLRRRDFIRALCRQICDDPFPVLLNLCC